MMILETGRLLLREYAETDAEDFFRLNSDPEVIRHTGDIPLTSPEEARTVLREHPIADYRTYGYGRWACLLRETERHIGFAGPKFLPEVGETEIGFRFLRSCWGHGFATEAAQAVIAYSFKELALERLIGIVRPDNVASRRVLEKCGMTRVETISYRGGPAEKFALARK